LKEAGIGRVNISLDSLNAETFARITRGGRLQPVLEGIDGAVEAGLTPVKLNMVVMGGVNDHELADMVAFARQRKVLLRFIEAMPIGEAGFAALGQFVPATEIVSRLERTLGTRFVPAGAPQVKSAGPARYYRAVDGDLDIGIISAISQHFCETCNRVRLTSRGELVLCLGRENQLDLLTPLRDGATDAELTALIERGLRDKPWSHEMDSDAGSRRAGPHMVALGG
ncbi:MAG: radical SAM protein, partial [Magnetococcales bacterium]|nr:radical SAM protein [Magnetococcales bacterium]